MGQLRANKFDVAHESTDEDAGIVIIKMCNACCICILAAVKQWLANINGSQQVVLVCL